MTLTAKLIEAVRKRPCLWDKREKSYKNRVLVETSWDEVAKSTEIKRDEVKAKWKNLRDHYLKELKKSLPPIRKPSDLQEKEPDYRGKWCHFEAMCFLRETPINLRDSGSFWDYSPLSGNTFEDFEESTEIAEVMDADCIKVEVSESVDLIEASPPGSHCHESDSNPETPEPPRKKTRNNAPSRVQLQETSSSHKSISLPKDDDDMMFFKSLLPFMKKLDDLQKLRVRNEFHSILIQQLTMRQHENSNMNGNSSNVVSSNVPSVYNSHLPFQ